MLGSEKRKGNERCSVNEFTCKDFMVTDLTDKT